MTLKCYNHNCAFTSPPIFLREIQNSFNFLSYQLEGLRINIFHQLIFPYQVILQSTSDSETIPDNHVNTNSAATFFIDKTFLLAGSVLCTCCRHSRNSLLLLTTVIVKLVPRKHLINITRSSYYNVYISVRCCPVILRT